MVSQYLALKSIVRNLERAFFPILGIGVGVASIITILAISAGGKVIIENDLSHMGENRILVRGEAPDRRDLEYLESLNFVQYALPQENGYRDMEKNLLIYGLTEKARRAKGINTPLREGEIILENKTAEVYPEKTLRVEIYGKNRWLPVVGTYLEKNPLRKKTGEIYGITDISTLGEYMERSALAKGIVVAFPEGENSDELGDLVITALNRFNPSGRYEIVEGAASYNFVNRIKRTLGIFLGALGGAATIMGGIGVSNLMASQIQKRRGDIGMLMAIGAKRSFIFRMFFTEVFILTGTGAVLGGGLGVITAFILGNAIGIPGVFHLGKIVGVVIFAILAGTVFGVIPAERASRIAPAEAIRK